MRRVAATWRPAARLARREVRRRPWRTALVVTLVALPVAGATFAAILVRTINPTTAERLEASLGQADDRAYGNGGNGAPARDADELADAIAPAYPAGSEIVAVTEGSDAVRRPDGHLEYVYYTDQPLDEPLLEGTMHLLDGRPPRAADEVAVSDEVLQHADAAVGDRIELFLLGEVTVTGEAARANDVQGSLVVGTAPVTSAIRGSSAYVDAPPGFVAPDRAALDAAGAGSEVAFAGDVRGLRSDLSSGGNAGDRPAVVHLFGGIALVAMAIVATAAFAVAARRQLWLLGLLSASGASPAGLRRTVLLQGSVCGLAGSVIGVALGAAAAVAVYPHLNEFADDYVDALALHPVDIVVPLVLGTAAATGAAAFPAVSAARVPVLAALAGRKPQGRLPAWLPIGGALAAGLGAVGLGTYTRHPAVGWGYAWFSGAAVLVGGSALAPWLVSHTEPLARWLRGGARVAARDLARQRLRAGSVVAGVMVPAGLAVLAGSMTESSAAEQARNAAPDDGDRTERLRQAFLVAEGATRADVDDRLDQVREVLPDAAAVDVQLATAPGSPVGPATLEVYRRSVVGPGATCDDLAGAEPSVQSDPRWIVVNDPAQARAAGAPAEQVAALEDGNVVVGGHLPPDPLLCTPPPRAVEVDPADTVTANLVVPNGAIIVIVAPETAEGWGLATSYYGTLFRNPEPLTERQRDALAGGIDRCPRIASCRDEQIRDQLLGRPLGDTEAFVELTYPSRAPDHQRDQQAAVAGGILAFTLVIVAVALALAATESRDERALLDAVGASPRVRRSIVAWQAGLLPGLAMVLAIPGGLAVALALIVGDPFRVVDDFRVPWFTVGLLGLVVPLASAAVAWLATAAGGRRRRDLSGLALADD